MPALAHIMQQQHAELATAQRMRTLRETSVQPPFIVRDGQTLLHCSGNDYFGLTHHPAVIKAAQQATAQYGAGAGAARAVTGNHPLYAALEQALASHKKREAALVFGSGYLANLGAISTLVGKGDIIFADKLVHNCMLAGAQLSGAKLVRFTHNDMAALARKLSLHRAQGKHALILTESIFSMDGDTAPLEEISELAQQFDAWTLVDDAHGLGFVEIPDAVDVIVGTCSKGLGSYGGYVCAAQPVIDVLTSRAGSFLFTTALPAGVVSASHAALKQLTQDKTLVQRARNNMQKLTEGLGIAPPPAAILPVILGAEEKALKAAAALEREGIAVSAIRPPTVPENTARLRITVSAVHEPDHIQTMIDALKQYV